MKMMIEKLHDLQALYIKELRLLLSAEEVIAIKAPFMIGSVTDEELNQLLNEHHSETGVQIDRLREILRRVTGEADPLKCRVVYSLFDEIEDVAQDAVHPPIRNAAMLAEARRVEHYEIAAYSALIEYARLLGYDADVRMLQQSMQEETRVDQRLSNLGQRVYTSARAA